MAAKAKNVDLTKTFILSQTFKMELFVKIVNSIKLLIIFTKGSILDV